MNKWNTEGVGTAAHSRSQQAMCNAGSAGVNVHAQRRWIALLVVIALGMAAFVSVPLRAVAAAQEWLDVSYGGTFTPQHTYTSGGDEQLGGGSLGWKGDAAPAKQGDGSVSLAGGASGITYTAKDSFGSTTVDTGFLAEIEYQSANAPANMSTLFSAMGNIFVRAEGNRLVYGFSAKPANASWKNFTKTMNLPANGKKHIVQVKYEPAAANDPAQLTVWVDGIKGESVRADSGLKPAVSASCDKAFGIGYEVNPDPSTATRGWAGNFYRTRIASADSAWELLNLSELLRIDFNGSMNGSSYSAASGENMHGSLTARTPAPAVNDSHATLQGGTSGFDFTPTDFTLGAAATNPGGNANVTTGLIAEAKFTPNETGDMQTIFAAGGNIFLRYGKDGNLEFGISYPNPAGSGWTTDKVTASAPAGAEHVVSVAYIPNAAATAATLHMRVDGKDQTAVTTSALAALNTSVTNKVAFGNEVHPDATARNRGFKGTMNEIRFARTDSTFTTDDFKLVYIEENCDTSGVVPANTIDVSPTDCDALIKAKLSALRPTEKQADYLDWGQIGFVHFNVNTFTGKSWGHGDEDPAIIDTATVDTDQWAKTFADAGFKMMMVTVKHHDGFVLYDSRYNDKHDWPNTTTAKNGGPKDLFAEIVKSARKYGLKVGVYYSPADSYMEKQGVWGNGSEKTERTIPTLVEGDNRAARVASGELPTYKYQATDYGEYMLNQLYELLTDYGQIDEVWFDGAQGNTTSSEHYDYAAFYDLIGKLQPGAVQANAAPDARWIGNEQGWARTQEWNPQGVSFDQYGKITLYPRQQAADGTLGTAASIIEGVRSGAVTKLHWYPGEVDAKNGPEWFNNSGKAGPNKPKAMTELLKFYEQSVGRNAQFLLNIPPHKDGAVPQADVDIMRGYHEELLRRYGVDLALGKTATVASAADAQAVPAPKLTDGSKLSSDAAAGNTPVYTVDLGELRTIDAVVLGEDARNAGQQVESFTVQGLNEAGQWQELTTGTTIGQQRNLRLSAPVSVSQIRIVVNAARGPVQLTRLEIYNSESEIQDGPRAYFIDPSATVAGDGSSADTPMSSIEQLHDASLVPGSVILVKRGTKLSGDFAVFGYGTADAPITVTTYGEGDMPSVALNDVKATSLADVLVELGKDKAGWRYADSMKKLPAVRTYISQEDMQIEATSSENSGDGDAEHLLDGRLDTIWHSKWSGGKADGPHWIVLDLGDKRDGLASLDYLARTGNVNGVAKEYKVWVSDSADSFAGDPSASGTLENVPYTQRIDLKGASGRYIKFQIDSDYSNGGFGSGAELNVELEPVAPTVPNTPEVPEDSEDPADPKNPTGPSDTSGPSEGDPDSGNPDTDKPRKPSDTSGSETDNSKPARADLSKQTPATGAQVLGLLAMAVFLAASGISLTYRRRH